MSNLATDEREARRRVSDDSKRRRYAEDDEDEEEEEVDEDEDDEEGKRQIIKNVKSKKLASGKRADQNRKAQRAFRQRKDKYIKDLELRSQELDVANSLIIQLKEENDRLNEIAKSFHNRVGELEGQLARMSNMHPHQQQQQQQQPRRASDYGPVPTRADDYYYPQRTMLSPRSHRGGHQYEHANPHAAIYSQTEGLL